MRRFAVIEPAGSRAASNGRPTRAPPRFAGEKQNRRSSGLTEQTIHRDGGMQIDRRCCEKLRAFDGSVEHHDSSIPVMAVKPLLRKSCYEINGIANSHQYSAAPNWN